MWSIFFEYVLSVFWSFSMLGTVIVYLLHFIIPLPDYLQIHGLIPEWSGLLIGLTSMIQIGIAMWIDSRYDEKIWRNYGFTIWYPIAFWLLSMMTTVVAFPRALIRRGKIRGRWVSPDRGLQ